MNMNYGGSENIMLNIRYVKLMRIWFGIILIISFISCQNNNTVESYNNSLLEELIKSNYEQFFLIIDSYDYNPPYKKEVIQLQSLSEKIKRSFIHNEIDENSLKEFVNKANQIVNYYERKTEGIEKKDIDIDFNSIKYQDILTLEYISVNMIVQFLYRMSFRFDEYYIEVRIPNNEILIGEKIEAEIFLIFRDRNNPFKMVIDKDTIFENDGILKYQKVVKKKGTFKEEGIVLLPFNEQLIEIPFEINYSVK